MGVGTLYRHFPTCDPLIEAVYRSEGEKLAAAERKFAEAIPPSNAMGSWMLLLAVSLVHPPCALKHGPSSSTSVVQNPRPSFICEPD